MLLQGGLAMCQRNKLLFTALSAAGSAFIISAFLGSVFLRIIIGILLIVIGFLAANDRI